MFDWLGESGDLSAHDLAILRHALYNDKTLFTKRIEVLKSVDLSYYWLYIGKRSIKEEFLKMLLRLRLIYIYDCVRYIKVKWGRVHGSDC